MSPSKRKTININSEEESSPKCRRSSLAVNLSYTNLTDSGNGSLRKTQIKNNESFNNQMQSYMVPNKELDRMQEEKNSSMTSNINKINNIGSCEEDKLLRNVHVRIIDIKHIKETDATCEKLRNAILNKTREIFNKQDECAIKTTLVLQNQKNKVLTTTSEEIIDQFQIPTDEVTSISNNIHNEKLSIFSTPINKSFNANESIDKSKITKRRLFTHNDIINPQVVKTVTEEEYNSKNNLQQLYPANLNYKSSPIISGNHKRHRISKLSLKNLSETRTKCNLEEDLSQKTISSLSILNDDIESIGTPIFCSTYNEELGGNNNKFIEEHNINNRRHKKNAKLVSMELTAVQGNIWECNNTCIEKTAIDNSEVRNKKESEGQSTKGKINQATSISDEESVMNHETIIKTSNTILQYSQQNTEKNDNIKSTIDKNEGSTEELESSLNVNTSVNKESEQESVISVRSSLQVNTSLNSTYRQSYNKEQQSKQKSTRTSEKHSQYDNETADVNDDSTSYIESTPYNMPQSDLLKSQLKWDTVIYNTKFKDPTKIVDTLSNSNIKEKKKSVCNLKNEQCIYKIHTTNTITCIEKERDILHKQVTLDDSPIVTSNKQKCKEVIIEDSLRGHEFDEDTIKNNTLANVNVICSKPKKKKLLPLCESSELSFSPMEKSLSPKEQLITKKKKQFKKKRMIKQNLQTKACNVSNDIEKDNDSSENNVTFNLKPKNECKKPRKVISKKIVIKKMAIDNDILKKLENLYKHSDQEVKIVEHRNSLNEFQTRKETSQWLAHKSQKIIMVVTGFSNGDKNLIKSIVKSLGMASIESNVTRRTTHVVSTGVRTLNLLHGIIRGCWLVKLEWVLKSLENNTWLNPEHYEITHFSKAVKENRKDRELFGMAYIPELFVTSGFLHVENGTTPPAHILKSLIKAAGGRITEYPQAAKIIIGANGVKESWILDSITTGVLQPITQYQRK
ncbi:microcephalin [Vespula squamosa]|uniref:Microcephalin n=1 Tax=Vespula squamosa TaxID=30214 RepID=A0ABD2A7K6_VESSQ